MSSAVPHRDYGRIAIVGTGLIGSGWAIVFARAGHPVALFDSLPGAAAHALQTIGDRLADLQTAGLLPEDAKTVRARISIAATLPEALRDAIYVQESVLERVDVKTAVMTEIDAAIGPSAWVGSSSSGLGASLYTGHVSCRERCLVVHPVNPPYLIPVVELVPAPWTAPDTMQGVKALMDQVGQAPVVIVREIEGFILNRLQAVLLMEAWRLAEEGLASVADIDKTVSQGLGLRWAFMGPFETIDLNAPGGVADYAVRLGDLYRDIAASTTVHKLWDAELITRIEAQRRLDLSRECLTARMAWRDRRLMALALHKREMNDRDEPGGSATSEPVVTS